MLRVSHSVVSNSLQPRGLYPTSHLCPWGYPGKNTGVVATPSSRESCQPRDRTQFSCIAGKFFTIWATGEAPCKDQCKAFRERYLFILGGSKITADHDCSHEIKRCLLLGRKAMTNLDSMLKSRHHFANKGLYSQSYGFCSSHVWMWELDYKER